MDVACNGALNITQGSNRWTGNESAPVDCPGELSAGSRVLNTLELLELILSFLDCDDLLFRAQGVCSTWRSLSLTASSSRLKQALFLEAVPYEHCIEQLKEDECSHNTDPEKSRPHMSRLTYRLHPFISKKESQELAAYEHMQFFRYRQNVEINFNRLFALVVGALPGPWREMFITQPPCAFASFWYQQAPKCHPLVNTKVYGSQNGGVRLGQVVDQLCADIEQKDLSAEELGLAEGGLSALEMVGDAAGGYAKGSCALLFDIYEESEDHVKNLVRTFLTRWAKPT